MFRPQWLEPLQGTLIPLRLLTLAAVCTNSVIKLTNIARSNGGAINVRDKIISSANRDCPLNGRKKKRIKTWTKAFHVPCGGKIRKKKHQTRSLNWFYLPLFAEQTQWELVNAGFLLLLLSLSLTILTTFKKWYKIGIIGVFRSFQHTGTDRPYGCTDDQAMYKVTSMCKQNAKKANRTRVNVMCFLLFLLLCVFLPRAPVIVYLLL